MIPILYEANEKDFVSNGLGRLSDAISCKVIEERNGIYELEMTYSIDGVHYKDIQKDRLILAKPFDGGTNQAFRIYKITRPLKGVVTVYCEHISYMMNRIPVTPFEAHSCIEAFAQIEQHTAIASPFTFWTDKHVEADMKTVQPYTERELLGGTEGSILDIYGKGDYEFDNFDVKFHLDRGSDTGVTLRYGKNLTELSHEIDIQNAYTGIVPYWKDSEDNAFLLSDLVVWSEHKEDYVYPLVKIVDFSQDFEEQPTEADLRAKAESYISKNSGWNPNENIKVSFVALWQTEEYKNVANLERVKLCDTVTVVYDKLGVSAKVRVIKTDYDVLKERYNSIELGDSSSTNLIKAVADQDKNVVQLVEKQETELKKAVAHATAMIQGGYGGHVVMNTDANGFPNEILVMDTDDKATAVNVWRWNLGGLGHSHSGYDGPFDDVALTMDGMINASRILTGYMSASRIKAGVVQAETGKMIINLDAGTITLGDKALRITAGNFTLDENGNASITGTITATAGKIGDFHIGTGLYYGKTSLLDPTPGCYIGTDGFSVGQSGNYPAFRFGSDARGIANYLKFENASGRQSQYGLWASNAGNIASGGPIDFNSESWGTSYIHGNSVIDSYEFTKSLSDGNIKTNVNDISKEDAMAFLQKLRPVSFEYKDIIKKNRPYKDGVRHGFIAQEVKAVSGDHQIAFRGEDLYYSLKYDEFIADLVAAVQYLQQEIEELKGKKDGV